MDKIANNSYRESNSVIGFKEKNEFNILKNNSQNKYLKIDEKPVRNFYPVLAGILSSGYHIYNVINEHKNKSHPNKIYFATSTLFVFSFSYYFTKTIIRQIDHLEK